jgi:hypothetical protein
LPVTFDSYLEEAVDFMKSNSDTENFVGFYDFEIAKMERNLSFMQEQYKLDPEKLAIDRFNFANYFKEYDNRKGTNFTKTFPELTKFYQGLL